MLGINKITVSDRVDDRGNKVYDVEVNYFVETGKDTAGLPALDLSQNTKLISRFARRRELERSDQVIVEQDLSYPTYLGTELNPDIEKTNTGYKYPFYTNFTISESEDLSKYSLVLLLRQGKSKIDAKVVVELFSEGELVIDNALNIGIEDQRTDFYDNIFDIQIFTTGYSNNNSSLSSLYVSYGKEAEIKGIFVLDKQKFLMENSDFGHLLNNSKIPTDPKRQMLDKSRIIHLEITRRKLAKLRDFENRPYPAYKNQVSKNIATATFKDNSLTANEGDIITQLFDITLNGMEHEDILAFNDADLSDLGDHQYSVKMRIQDGILAWMISTTDRLIKIHSKLKVGQQTTKSSTSFLTKTIFTLNDNINMSQKDLTAYLKNMMKYEGSLNLLKSYITNLVNTLSSTIGKAGVLSQVNSSLSKVYSKDNTSRFVLTLEKRFDETVSFSEATNLTYDYMGFDANNNIGATKVSRDTLQERFDNEYDKIIKERPTDGFANFSRLIYSDVFGFSDATGDPLKLAYFNFEPNYYAFLSPVKVGTTSLSPSNTFNYDLMTDEHFKKSYDSSLTPGLSISYCLQEKGVSLDPQFFREDPPLEDAQQGQTYLSANSIFSDSDKVVTERPGPSTSFDAGILAPPESAAARLFASTFLRNEEGWNLSKKDFDLTNTTNIISSVTDIPTTRTGRSAPVSSSPQLKIITELPNQIRAILASRSDKCVNQWLSPSMQGDYIYSPTTYYTIKQNYMNLLKIEYLAGFEKDANGLPDVKNPIFKKLTDLSGRGKILCRASIYNDQRFKIGVAFDTISYADKYFILDLTETSFGGIIEAGES